LAVTVAGGDAPELLDPLEEVLDEMAPLVHLGVVWDRRFAVRLGRDDGNRAAVFERRAQGVVIKRLVGEESAEIDAGDQRFDADTVVALSGQQNEAGEIAQRVDQRDDFAGQAAAGAADRLILSPPFAPAPCR
jgi:hypothetical protein